VRARTDLQRGSILDMEILLPCLHDDRELTLANTNGTMNGDGEGDLVADLRGGGGGSTILTTRTKKVYR
jgi:hypothetical protein